MEHNQDVCVERFKNINHRVDKIEDELKETKNTVMMIHELTANVKAMVEKMGESQKKMESLEEGLDGLKSDIQEIKLAPLDKFNQVWMYAITTGVGALVMFIIQQFIG